MILHLALLASSTTSNIDMAYNLRRYKQGTAKSYFLMYIANHTGANKKRISTPNCEAHAPIWIDRNHLAWVEQYDPAPIKGIDSIDRRDCKARVMILDLIKGSAKKLASLPTQSWKLSPHSYGDTFESMHSDENNEIHSKYFRVSLAGISEIKMMKVEPPFKSVAMGTDTDDQPAPRKATLPVGRNSLQLYWDINFVRPGGWGDVEAMKNSHIHLETQWKGKKSNIKLRGNSIKRAFVASDGTGFILTEYTGDRSLEPNFLYRFNANFSQCKLLSRDIGPMILSSDRRFWHAYQVEQDFLSGGLLKDGRSVEVSSLFTGDWTTGQQWKIESGLVQSGSCRFRPSK